MKSGARKRAISFFFSFIIIFSFAGCSAEFPGKYLSRCVSCTAEGIKNNTVDQIKQDISQAVPGIKDAFGNDNASQSAGENTEESAVDKAFRALDRELFVWYSTQNILCLNRYCTDPMTFGIDKQAVRVSLGDYTEDSQNEWISSCRSWMSRLDKFDSEKLSENNRLAFENYRRYFENEIASEHLFFYQEPLEANDGVHVTLPLMLSTYRFNDSLDIENYLQLLSDLSRYFDQILQFEKTKAQLGLFMTESMLDSVEEDIIRMQSTEMVEFMRSAFRDSMDKAAWVENQQKESYNARNDALIDDAVLGSYKTLFNGLEALRPSCRKISGAKEAGGEALSYFALQFQKESASNLSVEDGIDYLEDAAMDLYAKYTDAYQASSKGNALKSTGTLKGDERYLRTIATDIVPSIPDITVEYRYVPIELKRIFSNAMCLPPSMDEYHDNIVLIDNSGKENMLTIAREAFPGYLYQHVYQYELGRIPFFQIAIEPNGYCDGWARYAEYCVATCADIFGAADCCVDVLNDILTRMIAAICSLKVNGLGSSRQEVEEYLKKWGMESYASMIYEQAVNSPYCYFRSSMGLSQMFRFSEKCRERYAVSGKVFNKQYLSYGPSYYDLLEPVMLSWAVKMSGK